MATFDPITLGSNLQDLVAAALASDGGAITIDPSSIVLTGRVGENSQTSLYDGSLTELEIGQGILLTSGSGTPPESNTRSSFSVNVDSEGDAQLDAIVAEVFAGDFRTFDANSLEFTFEVDDPEATSISFDLVFGSEEFPEFVDSFVDIAAVFVNGENVALFDNGLPLSVLGENFEEGNFIDNTDGPLRIEYDGVSDRLSIVASVTPGVNTIKFAVADTGDSILDSGLFISNLQASAVDVDNGGGGGGILISVPGTENDDMLIGTDDNEFFDADAGNDVIQASGGNDVVDAGSGDDLILGDSGNDNITAGAGNDVALGNGDIDVISGDAGDDFLYGDFLSNSAEKLIGGEGNDTLLGNGGDDELIGNAGDDLLDGGAGADILTGGTGRDTFQYGGDALGFVDTITDFEVGVDTIQVFAGIASTATLEGTLLSVGGIAIANVTVADASQFTVNVNGLDVGVTTIL